MIAGVWSNQIATSYTIEAPERFTILVLFLEIPHLLGIHRQVAKGYVCLW